jgi:hypothetical protein
MPIDVFWGDGAQTILRANFRGSWTWEEFHAAIQLGWDMCETVNTPIIKLNDWRESAMLPYGNVLEHFARANNNTPTFRAVISVGASSVLAAIVPIAKQISGNQNRFLVDTMEEAYAIIERMKQEDTDET